MTIPTFESVEYPVYCPWCGSKEIKPIVAKFRKDGALVFKDARSLPQWLTPDAMTYKCFGKCGRLWDVS